MKEPSRLLTITNKAFALIRDGNDADAAKELERALGIAKEPSVIRDICFQLGQCYVVIKDYKKAEKVLIKARENCKEDETALLCDINTILLTLYSETKNNNGIIQTYKNIIKTNGLEDAQKGKAISCLAGIYTNEEKYAEGLKFADEMLEIYHDNTDLLAYKIKLRHLMEDYEVVLNDGSDYIEKHGFNFNVYNALGTAYNYFGHPGTAFKYLKKAFESIPENEKSKKSTKSQAFLLSSTILSGSLYHEECSKEFLLELLKRRYNITSALEKNINFEKDYGFFKRLRIGYLSADLTSHPVGEFTSPIILNRNTCHSDNICYSITDHKHLDNPTSNYLKESAANWYDLYGKTDDELEKFILDDKPDILLELASLTESGKLGLYARRLAPLQVSWIGFPISTGVKAIDYVITDKYVDPPDSAEEYYTEKFLYLPDTFLCLLHDYAEEPAEIAYDRNGYVTFGCFNNASKITNRILSCWSRILKQIPKARILLKSNSYKNPITVKMLKENIVSLGLDLDRIDMECNSYFSDYLNRYNDVDIMLDTYPFNGATTTLDAFMMGVPLVSLVGERHVSRVAMGMLVNVGLGDLAVYTEDDYVETAVQLARNKERLRELKCNLRDTMLKSKLADVDAFRAEYEHAMRRIWVEYCKKARKHPAYGGLSLAELSDSLVNGAFFMRKLIADSDDVITDAMLLDEYISLQRVFFRKLEKAWRGNADYTKPLETIRMISGVVFNLKSLNAHDMDEILLANTRFIKHYSPGRVKPEIGDND